MGHWVSGEKAKVCHQTENQAPRETVREKHSGMVILNKRGNGGGSNYSVVFLVIGQ